MARRGGSSSGSSIALLQVAFGTLVLLWEESVVTVAVPVAAHDLHCGPGPTDVFVVPGRPVLLDCPAIRSRLGSGLGSGHPGQGFLGGSGVFGHRGGIVGGRRGPVNISNGGEQPLNVTWRKNGMPLLLSETLNVSSRWTLLPNGSIFLSQAQESEHGGENSDKGEYVCVAHRQEGTLVSRTIQLEFAALPRFQQHPASQTVQEGRVARFQCRIRGLPEPSIRWEKNRAPIVTDARHTELPSGVLHVGDVRPSDAGLYRCVASNTARRRTSPEAILTVQQVTLRPQPADVIIVAPPENSTVVVGQTAVLECFALGQPPPIISWYRLDNKPIALDIVPLGIYSLVIRRVEIHHAGVYVCRANKLGERKFVSAAAQLTVYAPPIITQHPETSTQMRASTARFLCRSSGQPVPRQRWLKNGQPVVSNGRVNVQNGNLIINQVRADDAGYYQCMAESPLGSACALAVLKVSVLESLLSPPHHLTASSLSNTSVLLSWERPLQHSERIIGFSLHYQRATGINNKEYQEAVNNDTTQYLIEDLEPNTNYTFYVVAYSQRGASSSSGYLAVHTLEGVPMGAPHISLLSRSANNIAVTWLPLSGDLSRGRVIKYRVEYFTQSEDAARYVEVNGSETQAVLGGVLPNRVYKVRITAASAAGYGAPSEWMQYRTPPSINRRVPLAPAELKVEAKPTSLWVIWLPPTNMSGVRGYRIFYRKAYSTDEAQPPESNRDGGRMSTLIHKDVWMFGPVSLRRRTRQFKITGLEHDTLYEVKLVAYNKHSDGYAAVWKGKTARSPSVDPSVQPNVPLPPTHITATPNGSTTMWLHWRKPLFSAAKIVNYTVRCSPSEVFNASYVLYFTCTSEELLLSGLKPYTRYIFAVQSHGADIHGPFGASVEQSTLPDRPSDPPKDIKLRALDSSRVLVCWQPPAEPNGVILEYVILYNTNHSQPYDVWAFLLRPGSVLRAEVKGLQGAMRYFFRLGARTVVGGGPYSPVQEVNTPPTGMFSSTSLHLLVGVMAGVCVTLGGSVVCGIRLLHHHKARQRASSSSVPRRMAGSPSVQHGKQEASAAEAAPEAYELETLMTPHSNGHAIPFCSAARGITTPDTLLVQLRATHPTALEAELQSLMSTSQYRSLDSPQQLIKTNTAEGASEYSEMEVTDNQTSPCAFQKLPDEADFFNSEDSYGNAATGRAQDPVKDISSVTEHCAFTACTEAQGDVRNGNGDVGVPAPDLCTKDFSELSAPRRHAQSSGVSTAEAPVSERHLEPVGRRGSQAASSQRLAEAGLSPCSRNKHDTLHVITTSALIHHNP
ncbi:immunoglobulin superfamily DCC subclass member 4-like [Petromyzon marinus]|uniref:immunoglobulin superfamily DCC subclass member 4-like n=1 Tax=Petromyzon marinus TaxID=7757 RepID=UPI003F717152